LPKNFRDRIGIEKKQGNKFGVPRVLYKPQDDHSGDFLKRGEKGKRGAAKGRNITTQTLPGKKISPI